MTFAEARRKFAIWRGLAPDDRHAFWRAAALVPTMHVVVRVIGFNRLQQRVLRVAPSTSRVTATDAQALRRCVVNVNRVKRYSPLRGNCLSQSFALVWMLRREGLEPQLRLGVRIQDAKFDAHAWVEYDGRVLNDSQDVHTRFAPLVGKTGTP